MRSGFGTNRTGWAALLGWALVGAVLMAFPGTASGEAGEAITGAPRVQAGTLAAGTEFTCAVLDDASVKCWGANDSGQLGLGDTDPRGDAGGEMGDTLPAVALGTDRTASAVATGEAHSCALLDNAAVKCWGANGSGQLGLGDTDPRGDAAGEMGDTLPAVTLGAGVNATAIATGATHTCALLESGSVKCWGANGSGQLGLGDTDPRGDAAGEMGDALPAVSLGTGRTATAITAGAEHTCALLDDATVKCWGANGAGRLGLGDTEPRGEAGGEMGDALPAVDLGTDRTALAVTAGDAHTCALLDNASVKCWGGNGSGQLGQSNTTSVGNGTGPDVAAIDPVDLGTDRTALAVTAGDAHTCALLDDASVKCWGVNASGQLGQSNTTSVGNGTGPDVAAIDPVDLGTDRTALAVTAGDAHTCVGLDDLSAKCFGSNTAGQLGQGNTDPVGDGTGPAVAAIDPVDLGTDRTLLEVVAPPGPPTGLVVTPGDTELAVIWTPPIHLGGSAVVDYVVEYSDDGGATWTVFDDGVSVDAEATITGLTNGTEYTIRIAAVNAEGQGASSATATGTPTPTPVDPDGYLLIEEDGTLFGFGPARDLLKSLDPSAVDINERGVTRSDFLRGQVGSATVVDLAPTADGQGFWVLLDTGVILNHGTAAAYPPLDLASLDKMVRVSPGSTDREPEKVAAMSALPGDVLWVFTTAGRILPVDTTIDADTMADMDQTLALDLDGPMVGSTASTTGNGAYLTASDGGVFAMGDAVFVNSVRGAIFERDGHWGFPHQPITDIVPDPDGFGYYVAGADGGVFAFDAPFVGSLPEIVPFDQLEEPVNGMVTFGGGYILIASDGGVFNFSGRPFQGSAWNLVDSPVVAIAPTTGP